MKITNILTTKGSDVFTIAPTQTVSDAVEVMVGKNVGALVVVDASLRVDASLKDDGKIVGILTERHIIQQLARTPNILEKTVAEVMNKNPVVVLPQDDLLSVANIMTERRCRHLPVIENNQLMGIISIGDVLKAQRDQYRGEVDTLEMQLLAEE